MRLILLLACLVLASCVGTDLKNGLECLKGKPITDSFNVLGYPSRKMEIGETTVYYWSQSNMASMPMPGVARSTGTVGGMPVSVTTNYTEYSSVNLYGEIQLATNSEGEILSYSYNGNNGGLMGYASALGKYARRQKAARSSNPSE